MSSPSNDRGIPPDPSIPKDDRLNEIIKGVVREELSNPAELPSNFLKWVPTFVVLEGPQHGPTHRNDGPDPIPMTSTSAASSSFTKLEVQSFGLVGSFTYTTFTGAKVLVFEGVSPGGGGGGVVGASAASAASAAWRGAGGGGGGGYARVWIDNPEASYDVVVGAGGVGGTSGSVDGVSGGVTSVSAASAGQVFRCDGGLGGYGIAAASSVPAGGTPGSGAVGDLTGLIGGYGGTGAYGAGGVGGTTVFGSGGRGGAVLPVGGIASLALPIVGTWGGGGGGACQDGRTTTGYSGKAGGDGLLWVTAYG